MRSIRLRLWLRYIAASYGLVLALALLAWRVPALNAFWLAAAIVALSLPMMLALWHARAVARLRALHELRPERWPYRWASLRMLGNLVATAVALLVTASVVLASPLFGAPEWVLICVAPLLLPAVRIAAERRLAPFFTLRLYSASRASAIARRVTVAALALVWVAWRSMSAVPPEAPIADVVHGLQSAWPDVPSAIVRTALDAGAWGQAVMAMMQHWSDAPLWKLLLAVVVFPGTLFGYAVFSLSGLALGVAEIRRTFAARLTAEDAPAPIGPAQVAVLAAIAAVGLMIVFSIVAHVESALHGEGRLLAVVPLPKCERIGGSVYRLETVATLQRYLAHFERQVAAQTQVACARLVDVDKAAAAGVEAYLDWYFSLGAEWTRLAAMLTGDVDALLAEKFSRMVIAGPAVAPLLAAAQDDQERIAAQIAVSRSQISDLLERNRLVLDESQCRPVTVVAANEWTPRLDNYRMRLAAGSGAALTVGAITAKITAKVMTKTTMKSAGKVLTKVAAKKALSQGTTMAAGAAIGSAVPGAGTLAGAAVGAAVGLAIGSAIDIGMLAAEEHFTRDDMRADLLAAVSETLRPYREALGCAAR